MRKYLTILSLFFLQFTQAQTANAGADQTIYLTSTNQVTLNGSSSTGTGLTYLWTEVSSDYMSGATITSPTSSTTTVTGLPQGTFYFELTVRDNLDRTSSDTVVIRVDYDAPPASSTLFRWLDMSGIAPTVNRRDDTTTYYSISNTTYSQSYTADQSYYLYRDNNSEMMVDSLRGKFYSIAKDGVAGGTGDFARIEVQNRQSDVDTTNTNIWEWRGYLNYDLASIKAAYQGLEGVFIFQLHGTVASISDGPPIALVYYHDSIGVQENFKHFDLGTNGGNGSNGSPANPTGMYYKALFPTSILHNQSHTIRFIVKEGTGYPGQTAFVRIELDGQTVYYRNNGQVGESLGDQTDYLKYGSIYDYNKNFVDPENTTRGRELKVVTEKYSWYKTTAIAPPTISVSGSQTISVDNTTITASGTAASGQTITYQWTKISGNGSITSPTSASTSVTGLSGTSVFQCTVTQSDGQTASGTVTINVIPAITNYFITHGKTIYINQ
jgi:hypothetical protein